MALLFSRSQHNLIIAIQKSSIRNSIAAFSGSTSCAAFNPGRKTNRSGRIWRAEHKLVSHINQTPELMEGADYTFVDGRPTPYGFGQYSRIARQKELATQIVQALEEMNYAVERYNRVQKEKEDKVQDIINKKLKPKGGFIADS